MYSFVTKGLIALIALSMAVTGFAMTPQPVALNAGVDHCSPKEGSLTKKTPEASGWISQQEYSCEKSSDDLRYERRLILDKIHTGLRA